MSTFSIGDLLPDALADLLPESWRALIVGDPWFLALLIPLAAAVVLLRRRRAAAADGASCRLLDGLPRTFRARTAWLPGALLAAAAALLVLALARPLAGRHEARVTTEGVDIMLAIDRSSSMLSDGLEPGLTNLDVVKEVVARFVEGRPDDRIGLVSFARYARTECPLTLDTDAVQSYLERVECVRPYSEEDGTAIGLALGHAALKLEDSDAKSRIVVLLTDGIENQANVVDPAETMALCAELGVKVYTILADARLGPLEQRRAAALLARIADETGGRGFRAGDAELLQSAWEEIDRLETTERVDVRYTDYDDLYPALVLAALVLIGAELLLARGPYLECAT